VRARTKVCTATAAAFLAYIVMLMPLAAGAGSITLTPTAVAPGASVSISGTSFGATKAVGIGFGAEVKVINEVMPVTGPFDVGAGPYVGWLSHPIKPGTFAMAEYIPSISPDVIPMFEDAGNGTLIKATAISQASVNNATLDYAIGKFTVFTFGPVSSTANMVRYVNYTCYQYDVTPIANITTNAAGSFSANITVPGVASGSYSVTAVDAGGNRATASLMVAGSSAGWSKTYGGTANEGAANIYPILLQTNDGGFLITGNTYSYGVNGSSAAYLVKTDANGNMQWNKTYGGTGNERAAGVRETSDGGYVIAAMTSAYGAGGYDGWLLKIDANGNLQWNKTYGGTAAEVLYDMVQTSDGGYALCGGTYSFGAGNEDVWVVKTDIGGNVQWNKTFGGTGRDEGDLLIPTADGGYAVVAFSTSTQVTGGSTKAWLIKLDSSGNMVWNQTYGVGSTSYVISGSPTADGGFAMAGVTGSKAWLIKTDSSGNMLWNQTYGGTGGANVVVQTDDGGYALVGFTTSSGAGGQDAWLIRTDSSGNALWNMTYGGSGLDASTCIIETSDGGFAISGYTNSFGAGGYDLWLIKIDAAGVIPESLTAGVLLTLSTFAVIVSICYLRKRPSIGKFR
jgi:hypothetical protein